MLSDPEIHKLATYLALRREMYFDATHRVDPFTEKIESEWFVTDCRDALENGVTDEMIAEFYDN